MRRLCRHVRIIIIVIIGLARPLIVLSPPLLFLALRRWADVHISIGVSKVGPGAGQ